MLFATCFSKSKGVNSSRLHHGRVEKLNLNFYFEKLSEMHGAARILKQENENLMWEQPSKDIHFPQISLS